MQNLDDFIAAKLAAPSTASKWGHSFIEAFNRNKRSFYLGYVLGLESTKPRVKALRGTALHAAIESIYTARDDNRAPDEQMRYVSSTLLGEWLADVDPDERQSMLDQASKMALDWLSMVYVPEADTHTVVAVELLVERALPNGFPFTMRLDRVIEDKATARRTIRDTKTTGWRIDASIQRVTDGDQMTAYLWGYPQASSAQGEVCYVYKNSHECRLTEPITRNKFELDDYADKLVGLYADLAGRLRLWPKIDPGHMSLLWPGVYDETSVFEDEFVKLRRLAPRDLDNVDIVGAYGFRVNEQRRANIVEFVKEWAKFDDGILGHMLDNTGQLGVQ